jgi:CRISPR-associated protein Csm5
VDGARPDDSTPVFAEMAIPGSTFEGAWEERASTGRAAGRAHVFDSANQYAGQMLALQKQYAAWSGLELMGRQVSELERKLASLDRAGSCLVSLGWGGGLLSKTPWIEKDTEAYRQVLRNVPLYKRAIESGLPFPKTRRIVFQDNKPASLPGWALLEVA